MRVDEAGRRGKTIRSSSGEKIQGESEKVKILGRVFGMIWNEGRKGLHEGNERIK